MTDAIFERLSRRFDRLHAAIVGSSIPPENLLQALLLQGSYTLRSERLLIEQLKHNLLFRWFFGLSMGRSRVGRRDVHQESRPAARRGHRNGVLAEVLEEAKVARHDSDEHFTVDGTLMEAWASQKSFRRRNAPLAFPNNPGNPTVNFRATSGRTTTRTNRRREPMRGRLGGRPGAQPSSRISGICSSRIAMG
jgi:transposase